MNLDSAVDFLLSQIKGDLRIGVPLGLGKPNILLNRLIDRMKSDPSRRLEIYTALSLDPPHPKGFLAERFFEPFRDRHFGKDYPRLRYLTEKLPAHIQVHEFYVQAGQALNNARAQCNYISLNYTHVPAALLSRDLNAIVQLVARHADGRLSLSCNPDISIDLDLLAKESGKRLLKIAVVHPDLPFMEGDAAVSGDFFDAVVEDETGTHELFALPRMPVDLVAHAIALHASSLVSDAGTIQIGIGALGDALTHAILLRHQKNDIYLQAMRGLRASYESAELKPFAAGLFGLSEMVMDGFMHLRRAGILRREIRLGSPIYLQGGFFLGSKPFYEWLRTLEPRERHKIFMSRISKVNDLYDPDETEVRKQRPHARFFNTAMRVNLMGGAVSDTLDDGEVVSGVGGQYNFVAMAHELKGARSVVMVRSTRQGRGGKVESNITMSGGQLTIPRHLRDVVVTEYGVADLRGKPDEECARAMLAITDSRFQERLAHEAKKAGKLAKDFRISTFTNLPERLRLESGVFSPYPFGSDFTPAEQNLVGALECLKTVSPLRALSLVLRGGSSSRNLEELKRMDLESAKGFKARFMRRLLLAALDKNQS